ncbi:ABC transporter related protein [Candidatus Rickettsiella viridis]|uniref:ABC transporter related protein n=1 Tax=Candidatus Rickettsiella viridis TaxID=676208 RepID=A0A2Z5UVJ1_9COXI|nr:ABC transporter ATP-binding protein [Candidatus Rickettsiella viridis]BBB15041.1 ABC transporter related protein [Candidatus Rickettsiella viridis]
MAVIQLDSVSVNFPIYNLNTRSLKKKFLRLSTGGFLNTEEKVVVVKALDKVTFKLNHGDRVGLIGHNGAGKSTLLRVLAGIYEPIQGRFRSEGKVSSLLNIMLGINHESSGYENIMVRGLLLGLTRKEIRIKLNEIAEFTELGDYLFAPVRTYSAGMQLRLAFAVATCIKPDILLMDEMIEVGDANFVKKAQQRLGEFINKSSILVLASHSNETIKRLCNKVVLLEKGCVKYFGPVEEGFEKYNQPKPF